MSISTKDSNGEKTKKQLEWWKYRNIRTGYLDSYGSKVVGSINAATNALWSTP